MNLYELLYMIRTGDEYALSCLYQFFRMLSGRSVRESPAYDMVSEIIREEIIEECTLTILDALECYRDDQMCSFYAYAAVLVHNRMVSAFRRYFSIKRGGQTQTLSLEAIIHEDGSLYDVSAAGRGLDDPEYVLWLHEAGERYRRAAEKLTKRERELLESWQGSLNREASFRHLNISRRAYDSRMQRVRRKVFDKVLYSDD